MGLNFWICYLHFLTALFPHQQTFHTLPELVMVCLQLVALWLGYPFGRDLFLEMMLLYSPSSNEDSLFLASCCMLASCGNTECFVMLCSG